MWMGPPREQSRPRGSYSDLKSSRSSKWRRKLQESRDATCTHNHSLQPLGDDVRNAPGDRSDAVNHSGTTNPKLVEEDSLAEALSALAEQHLDLDVLDQSRDTSNFISYLLDTIQILEAEVNYNDAYSEINVTEGDYDEGIEPSDPAAPCFKTIHRIYCSNPVHNHTMMLFEDEPDVRTKSSSPLAMRLEGHNVIENLDSYLSEHPEFCFIVIKEHTCVRNPARELLHQQNESPETKQSQRSERLAIISPLLRKALDQIAQYTLQESHYIVEDGMGMDAPYSFFFHHREKLVELADDDTYGSVLSPLLGFLNENYAEEYEEAVSMFDRGVVNARHLQKLFQPNKLVILKTSDDFNVYALDDSPEILKEEVLFVGWSYVYSETSLRQKIWRDKMSPVGDKDVKISSLKVHPVSFGGKEDIENLTLRGQAFWGMKGQHYGCYTGWDHRHEHCYVGLQFSLWLFGDSHVVCC